MHNKDQKNEIQLGRKKSPLKQCRRKSKFLFMKFSPTENVVKVRLGSENGSTQTHETMRVTV